MCHMGSAAYWLRLFFIYSFKIFESFSNNGAAKTHNHAGQGRKVSGGHASPTRVTNTRTDSETTFEVTFVSNKPFPATCAGDGDAGLELQHCR